MRRRLFTFLSAVSLVLCLATVVLWVRSYFQHDELLLQNAIIWSSYGNIAVARWPAGSGYSLTLVTTPFGIEHALLHPFPPAPPPHYYRISYAVPATLLLLPTVTGLLLNWKKRRLRQRMGYCAVCGYDLRATPDRCPECGTVPSQPPVIPAGPKG